MKKPDYTESPWFVADTHGQNGHVHRIRGADGDASICETSRWLECDPYEESRANARLIAAAPDLAEALHNVHSIICEGAKEGFNPLKGDWAERLFSSNQKTSDALLKAGYED